MNIYKKYCPNVYLAQCPEQHEKGEEIMVQTSYGGDQECIIHNLVYERDGFYFYSVVRADGFDSRKRAEGRAKRREAWAESTTNKSNEAYQRAGKDSEFLSLGEPIKVGHHSEKKHRKMFDDLDRNMRKSIELDEKVDRHESVAEYWRNKADQIDLSMPESLDFFIDQLVKAEKNHHDLKTGLIPKEHAYSLVYAQKKVKEIKKKIEIAEKLWA